jgi:hypothetical protein
MIAAHLHQDLQRRENGVNSEAFTYPGTGRLWFVAV